MHWNVWLVVSSVTSEHLSRQSLNGLQYLGQHYLGQHYLGQYSLCKHCLQLCLPRPKKKRSTHNHRRRDIDAKPLQSPVVLEAPLGPTLRRPKLLSPALLTRCNAAAVVRGSRSKHHLGQHCLRQHYLLDAKALPSCRRRSRRGRSAAPWRPAV